MIYSLPYIALVLFYAILSCVYVTVTDDMKRNIRILCVFVYVVFFGFRGFVGDDWTIYYPVFTEDIHVGNFQEFVYSLEESPFEIGFTVLLIISKLIFDDYSFLVFLTRLMIF